ncbi:MAG: chemotaxis protein CheD [Candidatus Kariarchaeaceae archaeon]|jgi:chemotaxis protein CheD
MSVHSARIGEIIVARAPDKLEALALGSCVAVFIYDDAIQLGACAHILLPESRQFSEDNRPGKYADTAIPEMIRLLGQKGGKKGRLKAKLVGGARMFELTGKNKLTLDVGKRNIEATKKSLQDADIPVVADDLGADYGRSVEFDLETGILTIKVALQKVTKHI